MAFTGFDALFRYTIRRCCGPSRIYAVLTHDGAMLTTAKTLPLHTLLVIFAPCNIGCNLAAPQQHSTKGLAILLCAAPLTYMAALSNSQQRK